MSQFRDWFARLGAGLADVITVSPEGPGGYADTSKEGVGVFSALLTFVGVQGAALTIADQYGVPWWGASIIYVFLSGADLSLIVALLRLRISDSPQIHYFDRATILYGRFVFYVAILSLVGFGLAYAYNILTPGKPPFGDDALAMTAPKPLLPHTAEQRAITTDEVDAGDSLSLEPFAHVLSVGLTTGKSKNEAFAHVSWSVTPFTDDFGDFTVEVFPEAPDTHGRCLAFLYSAQPTRFGTTQYSLRQLYFEQDRTTRLPTRSLQVRSPRKGDRVVLFFWAPVGHFEKDHAYSLRKTSILK